MRKRFFRIGMPLLAAALCLVSRAGAQSTTPLTRYPFLQDVRPDRATVVWITPDLAEGLVEFSGEGGFFRSVPAQVTDIPRPVTGLPIPYYKYQATVAGLTPGAQYSYRVLMDGGELAPPADFRFRTAGPGPFTFLAFGDSGSGSPEQFLLAQVMFRENPALVLHTGDIGYPHGSFTDLRNNFFAIYSPLLRRAPFFPCPGNHEYESRDALPYVLSYTAPAETVPPPDRGRYYSFDWGDAHFVSLDTNDPLTLAIQSGGPMLRWLDEDLGRTRKLWRIVYFHHPVWPTTTHEENLVSALVRQHVEPILDRHDVQLVLSGHEHTYQQAAPRRGGLFVGAGLGTVNIVTGGGGGFLYPVTPREGLVFAASAYHYLRIRVDGPTLDLRAIDINGQTIDQFTLTTPPILSAAGVVNAASFTTALAPGSLISVFGRKLATEEAFAARLPLPVELGGASVTLNGRTLPLLFVSRTQINAQLPFDVQGTATLRVSSAGGSGETTITLADAAPAIFVLGRDQPAVAHASGTLVTEASPARPGETVAVFLTGIGRPDGDIAAGTPAPAAPLLNARGPIEAQIGALTVTPQFCGLAPGFAGLYQCNVPLPSGLLAGGYALRMVVRGVRSNTVNLVVR